jgi:hypothetical protein
MARIETDPNYSSPTFSRATASTDLFKKEDVQALASAMSTHVHDGAGKGLGVVPAAATIPGTALTNGSVTLGKLAADSVDSSKIVNGSIATADLADASVTNAKLAADTARANLLTNGGFEIWQRGNGPFTAAGAYHADRWTINIISSDTFSVSRDTTNIDSGSGACAAVTFGLVGGAGSSSVNQKLAVTDFPQLKGRVVSASCRVRCATANAVRIGIFDGVAWQYGAFHTGSGSYQTLTATVTLGASGDYYCGVFFAASCTAYVDNAMLVVGSVAADYAPMHPADDLARCQRYYQTLGRNGTGAIVVSQRGGCWIECACNVFVRRKTRNSDADESWDVGSEQCSSTVYAVARCFRRVSHHLFEWCGRFLCLQQRGRTVYLCGK